MAEGCGVGDAAKWFFSRKVQKFRSADPQWALTPDHIGANDNHVIVRIADFTPKKLPLAGGDMPLPEILKFLQPVFQIDSLRLAYFSGSSNRLIPQGMEYLSREAR